MQERCKSNLAKCGVLVSHGAVSRAATTIISYREATVLRWKPADPATQWPLRYGLTAAEA